MANTELYFSSYNEGANADYWLEVYNPTNSAISLDNYALGIAFNSADVAGVYDAWRTFTAGATIPARGSGTNYWILARDSADDQPIIDARDQNTAGYMTNGDDGVKLLKKVPGSNNFTDGAVEGVDFTVLDCIGEWQGDPGAGFTVAGVVNGTKSHTLVRKTSVQSGNSNWTAAAGTNTTDSEWIVLAQDSYAQLHSYQSDAVPEPDPTCFPKGTPVSTNLGEVVIENLNTDKHTIHGKEIVAITQSRPLQKHIVCFEKDALNKNVPSQQTFCSMEHKVFYKGEMTKARNLVDLCENVTFIPYNGETLFNVLLKKHDKMMINNLICETLHPENIAAKRSTMKNKAIQELTKIINNEHY